LRTEALTRLPKTEKDARRRFLRLLELNLKGELVKDGACENIAILAERISNVLERTAKGKTASEIIREVREEEVEE